MERTWDPLPSFLGKEWEPLAEPTVRATSSGYLVEAAGGGIRSVCSNLTAEWAAARWPLRLNPARSWRLTSEGLGNPLLQSDTGQPVSQWQGAGCSGGRVYLEGTACLYAAKFHTKTEVMGKTDMEEIICKVKLTFSRQSRMKKVKSIQWHTKCVNAKKY